MKKQGWKNLCEAGQRHAQNEKRPSFGPLRFLILNDPALHPSGLGRGFHFLLLDFLGLLDEIVGLLQ
jgi:hypothetical protein